MKRYNNNNNTLQTSKTCAKEMKHHKYHHQLESFSAAAPNWYNNAPSTASTIIKLSPVDHIRLSLCQPNWWNFQTTKNITDLCQSFAFQSQNTRMTEDADQQVVCSVARADCLPEAGNGMNTVWASAVVVVHRGAERMTFPFPPHYLPTLCLT